MIKIGDIVKVKTWNEISKTVVPHADKTLDAYRHKDTGLIFMPQDFLDELNREFIVSDIDEDGDISLEKSYNYYHTDWLEKV